MRILYHIPSLHSIYAQRTIYHGFKNAFIALGHEFRPLTADDELQTILETYAPDLFITATHFYYRKYLDFDLLARYREAGLFVLAKIDFWNSPFAGRRINEAKSLKDDRRSIDLIGKGAFADAFFHVVEQDDQRMEGFTRVTGRRYHTIPLAADQVLLKPTLDSRYAADISFVGSYLADKRDFFEEHVHSLGREYDLRIYGQDWTAWDRALGWVQRAGQYLNIGPLARIRRPKLALDDEARVYSSSVVSINVHEEYQRVFGGDCNERTFKIPLCGGFEVVDKVGCIKRYFQCGTELILAEDAREWVQYVRYYLAHPDERLPIIEAGRQRVLRDHTYHNRVRQIIAITQAAA